MIIVSKKNSIKYLFFKRKIKKYFFCMIARLARTFYNPPEISLCDICGDEEECRDLCEEDEIDID